MEYMKVYDLVLYTHIHNIIVLSNLHRKINLALEKKKDAEVVPIFLLIFIFHTYLKYVTNFYNILNILIFLNFLYFHLYGSIKYTYISHLRAKIMPSLFMHI